VRTSAPLAGSLRIRTLSIVPRLQPRELGWVREEWCCQTIAARVQAESPGAGPAGSDSRRRPSRKTGHYSPQAGWTESGWHPGAARPWCTRWRRPSARRTVPDDVRSATRTLDDEEFDQQLARSRWSWPIWWRTLPMRRPPENRSPKLAATLGGSRPGSR